MKLNYVKTQKIIKKKPKKEIKNHEKQYIIQTIKTYFYYYKKNDFWEHINQKHTLPQTNLLCFFQK